MAGARRPRSVDIIIDADIVPMESGIKKAMGGLQGLGKYVEGYFALGAIAQATRSVIDFAGRLSDLSMKAGVSVEWLQAAGYAAKQAGSSMDDVSNAVLTMRQSMAQAAQGSKTDLKAFKDLGITLRDIQSLSPAAMFEKIASAIQRSGGSARTMNAALAVLGRGGRSLLPAMTDDMGGAMDAARNSGKVASGDSILKADFLGDLWDGWMTQMKVDALESMSRPLAALPKMAMRAISGGAKMFMPGKAGEIKKFQDNFNAGIDSSWLGWSPFNLAGDFEEFAEGRRRATSMRDPSLSMGPPPAVLKPSGPPSLDRWARTGIGMAAGMGGRRSESLLAQANRTLADIRSAVDTNTNVTRDAGL
jgi:hypothetical protein